MSPKQAALNPDLKRLLDEGYEVDFQNGYLLVRSIPYVDAARSVRTGILVTDLNENVGELLLPKDHQVWFAGEFPCHHTGAPIEAIRHTSDRLVLWDGFQVDHRFSNKPHGLTNYPDYYSKIKNYAQIICSEAQVIDPTAYPRTFKVLGSVDENSVFRYRDSASSRANIFAVSAKLATAKIAIIGLGGTGAYVLDLLAKTPIRQIHLFDGDLFLQHNAFRAPGAASIEILGRKLTKVDYYARLYDAMHRGIVPHGEYVTVENLDQLGAYDFVFLSVDKGSVRKLISDFLRQKSVPFVDAGMGLMMGPDADNLLGTCRVTLSTATKTDHFPIHVPLDDDPLDDIYGTNIQVADMNALCATLAVIKWKQFCGFYQDLSQVHHTTFSINSHSLTRGAMPDKPGA